MIFYYRYSYDTDSIEAVSYLGRTTVIHKGCGAMGILCHSHKHTHWSNQQELLCVLSDPNPYTISFPSAETGSFYTKSIPFPLSSFPPSFFPLSHSTFQSHHIYCDVLSCLSNHFYPKVIANLHPKTVYVSLAYDFKLHWIPSISFTTHLSIYCCCDHIPHHSPAL